MSPRGLGDIDANQGAHFNRNEWPLLALNCRAGRLLSRQLPGVKRTSRLDRAVAAFDPKRTLPAALSLEIETVLRQLVIGARQRG
jgi:hypothetical protein